MCEWLQNTALSAAISESTWGFPIVGALHVLGIAWFGGAVLAGSLRLFEPAAQLRFVKGAGLTAMLATGVLLFISEPLKCYHSVALRVKLALLVAVLVQAAFPNRGRLAGVLSLTLWAGVILAARGIAFL